MGRAMNNLSRREREKLRHESEIVEAAECLFRKNGFEETSMNELAAASLFTKRTLYKYFVSKEDLFFAVILKNYQKLWAYAKLASEKGTTGIEKIEYAYGAFLEYFYTDPLILSLMGSLSAVKNKSSMLPFRQSFYSFNRQLFSGIYEWFLLGRNDGTLRSDIEAEELMYSSLFTFTGFLHMYQISGNAFLAQTGTDEKRFIEITFQMLIASLKPQ